MRKLDAPASWRFFVLLPYRMAVVGVTLLLPIAAAFVLLSVRMAPSAIPHAAPPAVGGDPDDVLVAAADRLAQSVAKGGSGYRFEIVQRSTINAKPGGPRVPVANPTDPGSEPIGLADTVYQIGLVETGFVSPDGFSMQMRSGPPSSEAKADVAAGERMFGALVKDGRTYRDDGEGWYETDRPPGIGLDPHTAALLPQFLRQANSPADTDLSKVISELGLASPGTRAIQAGGDVANLPGVIAIDGQPFTELTAPVVLTFDGEGRLSGLVVRARNTNLDTFDLLVVTEIAIHYDAVPAALPDPQPALPVSTTEVGS